MSVDHKKNTWELIFVSQVARSSWVERSFAAYRVSETLGFAFPETFELHALC